MKTVIASLVLAVSMTASAHAANIVSASDSCNGKEKGCSAFLIKGNIMPDDDQKFDGEIMRNARDGGTIKKAVVYLESDGGDVKAAITIGRTINKYGWATAVPANAQCVSACAMIWVAGSSMQAYGSSRIGFHAAYLRSGKYVREFGASNALIGVYYSDLGFSEKAIYAMTSATPTNMLWLKVGMAEKLGFAKLKIITEGPARPTNSNGPVETSITAKNDYERDAAGNRVWPSMKLK